MDEAAWSNMCAFMLDEGLIDKAVPVSEIMTDAATT
jgi:hypothetical protein